MKRANKIKVLKAASIAVNVLLVLLIVCLVCYIGSASEACSAQGVITVREVREYYETEDIVVDIYRPEVSGFSDKAFEKLLNKKIENNISVDKTDAELCSLKRKSYEFQYCFSARYWLKSSEGIFSLKVTNDFCFYWITNLPITEYYNVDIANNKLLTLGNLFTDDSYKERLYKYIADVMPENFISYSHKEWIKISDETKFYIMDGNLYIVFAKYEITSGDAGEPEFLIPTEEIRDLLKDEYKQIFK